MRILLALSVLAISVSAFSQTTECNVMKIEFKEHTVNEIVKVNFNDSEVNVLFENDMIESYTVDHTISEVPNSYYAFQGAGSYSTVPLMDTVSIEFVPQDDKYQDELMPEAIFTYARTLDMYGLLNCQEL